MPEWCPQCHAMLPPGLEECPRCGARLKKAENEEQLSRKDLFWYSAYTIGVVLIPIVVVVVIGLICVLLYTSR